jgi:hypothetical protein
MPVTLSWLLSSPPALSPFTPGPSLPPVISSQPGGDCPIVGYTQAELLQVIAKSYPADYLVGMRLNAGAGYEIFQTSAKVLSFVSTAVAEVYCCTMLLYARGGQKSGGVVEFYRSAATNGAITIAAGSRVRTSKTGREYVLLQAAVFGALELGPKVVAVEAIAFGSEYDVAGQLLAADGEVVPGEIDEISYLFGVAPALDPLMRVRQLVATIGGRSACLDGLGQDLLIPRNLQESDDLYRRRIFSTPDTVSPGAIERGLDSLLSPAHACLREIGTERFPGFYFDAGSSADAPQDPKHNFAYDMDFVARPADRFKLWTDFTTMRAFFLVGVPALPAGSSFGFVYDGAIGNAFPLFNAYDTTSASASDAAYDGFVEVDASQNRAIYDMITAKKAGGVGFELYLETIGCA